MRRIAISSSWRCFIAVLSRLSDQAIIAYELEMARTQAQKTKGLLGRKTFSPGEGLFIEHCHSIHMWFMKFPIDVLYVDSDLKILKVVKELKVWMFSACGRATHTIELPVGTVALHFLQVGDRLQIIE